MSAVRSAVEEAITALAAKVIHATDTEAAREYASALNDACWGLEHLSDAGEGES